MLPRPGLHQALRRQLHRQLHTDIGGWGGEGACSWKSDTRTDSPPTPTKSTTLWGSISWGGISCSKLEYTYLLTCFILYYQTWIYMCTYTLERLKNMIRNVEKNKVYNVARCMFFLVISWGHAIACQISCEKNMHFGMTFKLICPLTVWISLITCLHGTFDWTL